MSDLIVEAHALTKRYGSLAAVDGLNMRVERGAIYGFIGRNGAGKTTTLRILAGLTQATSGTARVLGMEVQRDQTAILERTGFVIDPVLLPWMTGRDLLRFNRGFFPQWRDELAGQQDQAMSLAGSGTESRVAGSGRADGRPGPGGNGSAGARAGG
jgi:ABC-2 type transport system ATP-binding protein